MRAVIVEDEVLIREGLCKLMNKMFPEIVIDGMAGNGKDGLACVEEKKPDLVITDIKMPMMDGLEMLTRIQELGIFPKVIVLTAYSEFAYAQRAVKLGVCDYIIKPVVVPDFVQTIQKIQNLYEQEQKRTPEAMGSLENIVSGILHGVSSPDKQIEDFLEKKYGIGKDAPLLELFLYLGDCPEKERERKRMEMCQV
ncbi:MAG: response regulator, partial [Kineothrix sp.]|nr:response regulator [Kineothrix sp.]